MSYDEIELEAMLLEIVELQGGFDALEEDALLEIIEKVREFTDGDYDEAYEFMAQYASMDRKRFYSLCLI